MWVSVCRNTVRERVRQNRRNELLADIFYDFARRRLQLPVRNLAYGNGSANHSLSVLSEILYRRNFFRRRQGITEILFIGKGKLQYTVFMLRFPLWLTASAER